MKRNGKKSDKPAMTAAEAQTFDRFSLVNAGILEEASALKGCNCHAYEDWFTYNRWTALGFQVQRGEHGTKIAVIVHKQKTDDAGKVEDVSFPHTSTVFCRCQVKPADVKEQATA